MPEHVGAEIRPVGLGHTSPTKGLTPAPLAD